MTHCPHCGCEIDGERSRPQHRRFFGLVRAAHHSWPEGFRDFQPESEKHLRAWLLCRAGYRTTTEIAVPAGRELSPAELGLFRSVLRAAGAFAFITPHNGSYWVLAPKSMNFQTLRHKEACLVMDECEQIICGIVGVQSGDELLEHHKRAA